MIKRLIFFASLLVVFHADAFVTRTFAPISSGLDSAKPASCVADLEFYGASDSGVLYRCNHAGTGWVSNATPKQPSLFGAKGDGIADDTAAMQLWVTSTFNGSASGAAFCPIGTYRVTAQLVGFGAPGVAGYLNGAEGFDRGTTGCNVFYDGPPLAGPVIKLVGVNNSILEHIGINANSTLLQHKAAAGILITNTSNGVNDLASSGVQLNHVVVTGIAGAGSYGVGIGTTPPVGNAQVSEITFDHVNVQGADVPGSCLAGYKSFVGGNTKNFTFYNPNINGCATAIDVTQHGGHVTIYAAQFGNTTVSDVEDHSSGTLNIFGGEAEDYAGAKFINVTSGANPGQVIVDGFSYQTVPALDQVVVICQAICNFRNNLFYGKSPGHPARVQVNNPEPGNGTPDSWTGSGNWFEFAGDKATCDPGGTNPFSSSCYTPIYDGSGNRWIDRIRNEKIAGAQIVSKNEFGGDFGTMTRLQAVDPGYLVSSTGVAQFANGIGFSLNGATLTSSAGPPGANCSNDQLVTDSAGSGLYPCINGQFQNAVTLLKNVGGVTVPQNAGAHGQAASFTITLPAPATPGNSIIVGVTEFSLGAGSLSVALTPSGTACVNDIELNASGHTKGIWRCPNVPSGTTGVTGSLSASDFYIAIALEVTGLQGPASPVDAKDSTGNPLAGSWSGHAMTPTANREELVLDFAEGWSNNTMAASAPYTGIVELYGGTHSAIVGYQTVLSTTGTYTPHGTAPGNTDSIGITYLGAIRAGANNALPKWSNVNAVSTANVGFQRHSNVMYVRVASTAGLVTGDTVDVAGSLYVPTTLTFDGSHGPITVTTCTLSTTVAPVSPGANPCYSYADTGGDQLEFCSGCLPGTFTPGTTMKGGLTKLVDSVLREVGAMTGSGVATNTDMVGRITLVANNGSYTFKGTYTTAPVCFFRDETTPANAVTTQTVSTTAITLVGTGTDVIAYQCTGLN